METTDFIWFNGELVRWEDAKVHVLAHTLHYGGGAFEGIRCYKTEQGTAIFRLREHTARLLYSSRAIQLTPAYTEDQLFSAIVETVRANRLEQGYIRPLVFFGYGKMGLNPVGAPTDVIIACWPWGAYLPHETIDVKISSYIRIHPQSTVSDAKLCGHYVNSIMAVQEVAGTRYHEALFLDHSGKVAEGPGENFFMVRNKKIYTPKLGSILAGITRDTVFKLASSLSYEIIEQDILPEFAFTADEAFFTGTAAEVTPIRSIDDHVLGSGGVGPVTAEIKKTYLDVVYGRNQAFESLLTYVK